MKKTIILLASLALASCATPKAVVIEQAPLKQPSAVTPDATEKKLPALANDGLRLPDDMLALPDENQLRSSAPIKGQGNATIITSPPKE